MTLMLTYEELEERNAQLEDDADRYLAEKEDVARKNTEWVNTFDAMMDLVMAEIKLIKICH